MYKFFHFGQWVGQNIVDVRTHLQEHYCHLVLGIPILALLLLLSVSVASGQMLVQDLTQLPYQVGFDIPSTWSLIDGIVVHANTMIGANGSLFFAGWDERNGIELWQSDATPPGTVLVKDIYPGVGDAKLAQFTLVNGILFFAANDGSSGGELWKTDGTPNGTQEVKDILHGPQSSDLRNLTAVNGVLFFNLANGTTGNELWKSDGTAAGTVLVKGGFPPFAGQNMADFTAANDKLYFTAADGSSGRELWTSDGTATGTYLVKDITPGAANTFLGNLTMLNDILFFTINGSTGIELWKSDGTTVGTERVQKLGAAEIANLITNNGTLFFARRDLTNNLVSLWKSDGTANGTALVREFTSRTLYGISAINSTLFFYLNHLSNPPTTGGSLWKSDGTTTGTVMIKELTNTVEQSITVNNSLIFKAGNNLWKSDGTTEGTVSIFYGNVEQLTGTNDTAFFKMCDSGKCALWKLDDKGFENLKPSSFAQGSSALKQLTRRNSELFFVKDIGSGGRELWRSDGTMSGSRRLRGFTNILWSATAPFVSMDQELFFSATDDEYSSQLWRSNGTTEGTTIFQNIWTTALGKIDGRLLFATRPNDIRGVDLWQSDSTTNGTIRVKRIPCNEARCDIWVSHIIDVEKSAFFSIGIEPFCCHNSRAYFFELWKTDGTEQGTVFMKRFGMVFSSMVIPSMSRRTPDTLAELTDVNGTLFFTARETGEVNALWRSDGTPEGTISLTPPGATADGAAAELTNVNGVLFFRIDDGINGTELWKSDGTVTGTVLVKDILPGPFGSVPAELTAVNDKLFFSANDGNSGRELWQSDGTTEGTVLVKEILPGPSGAVPQQLANVNGTLVFSASDGQHGVEAWRSDGTAAGTTLIQDIAAGMTNANPDQFTFAGDQLFFTANDGLVGQELWSLRSFTEKVDVEGGELQSWLDHATYQFPGGTFSTAVTVTHTLQDPTQLAAATPWRPIRAFELTVVDGATGAPVQPEQPYSLAIQYSEAELGVLIDSTLALYAWSGQQWTKEASSMVNLPDHLITATSTHTGLWAIGGETYQLFLPVAGK